MSWRRPWLCDPRYDYISKLWLPLSLSTVQVLTL
jgi:hypothetical protein